MPNYMFDVKLWATFRLDASNEQEARERLQSCLSIGVPMRVESDCGVLDGTASAEGDFDLIEVDGEFPEDNANG